MFDEIPISTIKLPEGRFQTFHDISLSENILSPPHPLFGFHSAQKLRYRAGRENHSICPARSFASLNLVLIWQTHPKTTYITFTIMQKEYVIQFYKMKNKLSCNLTFALQFIFFNSLTD